MKRKFKVVLTWDNEVQAYVVIVPGLNGCATQGRTKEEALNNAQEAISATLAGLAATGQPLPQGDIDVSIAEVVVPA